jgi:hypothetical protein
MSVFLGATGEVLTSGVVRLGGEYVPRKLQWQEQHELVSNTSTVVVSKGNS